MSLPKLLVIHSFTCFECDTETIIEHNGEARIRMYSAEKQQKDRGSSGLKTLQKKISYFPNNPLLKSVNSAKGHQPCPTTHKKLRTCHPQLVGLGTLARLGLCQPSKSTKAFAQRRLWPRNIFSQCIPPCQLSSSRHLLTCVLYLVLLDTSFNFSRISLHYSSLIVW